MSSRGSRRSTEIQRTSRSGCVSLDLRGRGLSFRTGYAGPDRVKLRLPRQRGPASRRTAQGAGLPGPIKTADGQLKGVVIERLRKVAGKERWAAVRTKGWAVMSRWGVEIPPRDAFLYVLDPDTHGEPPSPHERDDMVQDIARAHVAIF